MSFPEVGVVVGDPEDRGVIEQRHHQDYHHGQVIEIEDDDRQHHELRRSATVAK